MFYATAKPRKNMDFWDNLMVIKIIDEWQNLNLTIESFSVPKTVQQSQKNEKLFFQKINKKGYGCKWMWKTIQHYT